MTSHREKEYGSVAQCPFETVEPNHKEDDGDPTNDGKDDDAKNNNEAMPCVISSHNAVLRIQPSVGAGGGNIHKKTTRFRWSRESHFHELLRVPDRQTSSLCLTLEARAREGLALCLSPEKGFCLGETYEILIGDRGNTVVSLQRKARRGKARRGGDKDKNETKDEDEDDETDKDKDGDKDEDNDRDDKKKGDKDPNPENNTMFVQRPARICQEHAWTHYWIALLQANDGGTKLCVGVGDQPGQQCVTVLEDTQPRAAGTRWYVGLGNAGTGDRQAPVALRIRSVRLSARPSSSEAKGLLEKLREEDVQFLSLGDDQLDDEAKASLAAYQDECQKARARAEKFGVPYKEPPPTFLPWSQERRLRANPQQGFITGLDLDHDDEKAKQEARKQRFGVASSNNDDEGGDKDDSNKNKETTAETEDTNDDAMEEDCLPLEQAWDNQELVASHRTDPPRHLWKAQGSTEATDDAATDASFSPEKIHLFAIDWAAFKQIRTNDIMRYFTIYSPTYIEWLGDLSCNVHFQDKYSATRALNNLSAELPSPPPTLAPSEDAENDANTDGSSDDKQDSPQRVDLGGMGWRLGKVVLEKIANDRFGRKGTTARVLLRPATTLDILVERPNSWPKPPDGFTTKEVLGPGSDMLPTNAIKKKKQPQSKNKKNKKRKAAEEEYDGSSAENDAPPEHQSHKKKQNKKKKKRKRNDPDGRSSAKKVNNKTQEPSVNKKGEPSLLDRGLKASRDGFSAEQLEQERAQKRAKNNNIES